MSTQVLNERTFAADTVQKVTEGAAVTRTMSLGGTGVRALFLLVLTTAFAVVGWRYSEEVFSTTSGMLFLVGFILLIALTFAATVIGATFGIAILYLVAWLLDIFGIELRFLSEPTPLGIGISVLICLVAALNLFIDFEVVRSGVAAGAPKQMAWLAAFGLLSTLVWLYLEILRLLALLRGN